MPPPEIPPPETVARYLLQSNEFSLEKRCVKPTAFMPHRVRLDLSVFRIQGLESEEIWSIGKKYVATPRGKKLYGTGNIAVANIQKHQLRVVPNEPPPRHVDILGWPKEKDAQKLIALELSAEATLVLRTLE